MHRVRRIDRCGEIVPPPGQVKVASPDAHEESVLGAVQAKLFTPDAIERFVELLDAEWTEQNGLGDDAIAQQRTALQAAERGIQNCLDFVVSGKGNQSLLARIEDLERKKAEALAAIHAHESRPKLNPEDRAALKEAGIEALSQLPSLLSGAAEETRAILARLMTEPAVVAPSADKTTLEIKMAGHLAGLFSIPAVQQRKTAKLVNVVAGAGFEPTTFGL